MPLRWFVNWLNSPATACLVRAVELDEREAYGWRYKMYSFGWKYLNKPYQRWGTLYKLDLEAWKKDLSGPEWDDYDENGIPYWEKTGTIDPDYYGDKNVK